MTNSYLTFNLGNETFAIPSNNVINISEIVKITNVPKTPKYVKGMINFMGDPILVIDSHKLFEMENMKNSFFSCILILDIPIDKIIRRVGFIADEVKSVIDIDQDKIITDNKYINDFIIGIFNDDNNLIFILDHNNLIFK